MRILVALFFLTQVPIFPSQASVSTKISGPLKIRLQAEPATLDWNRAHTMIETYILMNLMEGLVAMSPDLKVKPALAEKWTVSKDGLTYRFEIRKTAKWSDGVVVRAQDFVASWKRLLSPKTAALYAYLLFDVVGAQDFNDGKTEDFSTVGVKAVSESVLEVKLKRAVSFWIQIPTFWVTFPIREDVVTARGDAWSKPQNMLTAGAYTLASHEIESKIVLKANPYYYGKRGNIDEVHALVVKDESTALTLFESGGLDFMTDLGNADLVRMKGRSELKTFPYLKTGYLAFAVTTPEAKSALVRRAIVQAIDRKRLIEILKGGQTEAGSFVPPPIPGSDPKLRLAYNPTVAKKMWDAIPILDRPRVLNILTPGWEKSLLICQFIQEQLRTHLGVKVNIESYDHKTFRARLSQKKSSLFLGSWSADYPDADNFLSVFQSTSGNNMTGWRSSSFDEGVDRARVLLNPRERLKIYAKLQKQLIVDEAVLIPLYHEPNMALISSRVEGLSLSPINNLIIKDARFR